MDRSLKQRHRCRDCDLMNVAGPPVAKPAARPVGAIRAFAGF